MSTFHHTRQIPATVEAVFQAIADPVRLARWWGPDGFTNTIQKFEFTPGGNWDFIMHGPEGANYPNQAMFMEIIPNSSVVLKHVGQPHFLLSISLAPSANGTLVTWVQEFEDPAIAANIRHIVEPANEQNLARWEHEVTTLRELTLTRTFDAPRALVWAAWTEPEHIMRWRGPKGFSNSSCESDLRVGGAFRLDMCAPDGNIYPCTGIFREIFEPERIVYDSTADESHPCGAGLPPRSVVTVTFSEHDGKTTLTLHTRFESEARRDAANAAGYSTSWGESLERLEDFLTHP